MTNATNATIANIHQSYFYPVREALQPFIHSKPGYGCCNQHRNKHQ